MPATDEPATLVARTAQALARLSLDEAEGAFIGGEEDLLRRLGVSRPTLRQAAKIAENDRLIEVRRGLRGGFYASRPSADDAIRDLARFLRLRGATLSQVMAVSRPVAEDAAVLAARCTDESLRAELAAFLRGIEAADTRASLIAAEARLAGLVAAMSGNPVIEAVLAIGYSFGMEEEGSALLRDPADRAAMRRLQHDLAKAILGREPDLAALMMRRRSAAYAEWMAAG